MSEEVRKYLKVAGIIAGVIVVGVGIGWLGSRGPSTDLPAPVATATPVPLNPAASTPVPSTSAPRPVRSSAPAAPPTLAPAGTAAPPNVLTNWEDRIDDILSADNEESAKANQMLAIFPQLPEDGQVEVAQHISNLISDQDYPALGQYLTNSALPSSVLDVLLAGLLNRPNSLKMPLLLDVARDDQNPKASDARDMLSLFLEEDYGNNWTQWQTKMDQWLKDNPD